MNTGVISNQGRDNWRVYRPQMLCAANGAVTHPSLVESADVGGGVYQQTQKPFGRWTIDEDGLVTAEIMAELIGAATVGSGTAYVWSLPVKARRPLPGEAMAAPLGTGMSYFSFLPAPNVNVLCVPTLADPWSSLGGAEDFYCQMIAPYVLSWGTDTVTSGASGVTTNHRCGFAVSAYDIEVVPTDADLGTGSPYHYISSITSTQMTIAHRTTATADHALSWKVRAEPSSAYVGPSVPWDWSRFSSAGPFGNFFIQLSYEAA